MSIGRNMENSTSLGRTVASAACMAIMFASVATIAGLAEARPFDCTDGCQWKSTTVRCKGQPGVSYPCHQWQKRCGCDVEEDEADR
jgi:hypothetical protein